MFTTASAYERFMGRWSRKLAESFAAFADVGGAARVLDVGCGTGALASAILSAYPAAAVTGIDPSAAFVESCRDNYPAARFEVGDVLHLPFDDRSFDASLACLVLNFVPSPHEAIAEMSRVTTVGGTIAAALWDHAEGMTMLHAFWEAADKVDPSRPSGEAQPTLGRDALAALWSAAGLREVRLVSLTVEMAFSSFDDYWSPFSAGQGPAGVYAASLLPEDLAAIARILRTRFLGERPDGAFTLHSRAWAIRGTVA
jgi:SAM-dependent methyltransferase